MNTLDDFLREVHQTNDLDPYSALDKLQQAPEELHQDLCDYFKHHLTDWINLTCVAEDPDHHISLRRFILFERQQSDIIDWIEPLIYNPEISPSTKIWEKSRRVGWTNTLLCALTFAAIFWEHSSLVASKDLHTADTLGDVQNSLLPRIRLLLLHQPHYLLPKGFDLRRDCPRGIIKFGPNNRATIKAVPTGTPQAAAKLGRSGRVRFAMFDEAAFWSSRNLEMAFGACALTARVRILLSSAAHTNSHFFSRLVDGAAIHNLKGDWIPFEVNPANTTEYLEQLKEQNTSELIDQEIFGKRGGHSGRIIDTHHSQSHADEKGAYDLEHTWLRTQLEKPGYLFTCYDGGMQGGHTGAVLGYHVENQNRDIIIAEEYSRFHKEPIADVALRLEDFLKKLKAVLPLCEEEKSFGDPALMVYGDDQEIWRVTGRPVNMLDSLRSHDDYHPPPQLSSLFKNRKTNRLNLLRRKVKRLSPDGKPELIWLTVRASMFHEALVEGGYSWRCARDGLILDQIEQNHPLVDIIEAYTYKVLETEIYADTTICG